MNVETEQAIQYWSQRDGHAKDIPDQVIYAQVRAGNVTLWAIQDALHSHHPKVVHAKLKQMVNKGRLLGCACGCRGDFSVPATPEEGRAKRLTRKGLNRVQSVDPSKAAVQQAHTI